MQSLLAWAIHSSRARARNQAACITVARAGSMHLFIGTWEGEPQNQAQQRQSVVRHGTGQRGENSKDWVRDSHEQMCCFGILHSQHLPRPGRPGPLNWSKYGYWEWRAHIKTRPTKTWAPGRLMCRSFPGILTPMGASEARWREQVGLQVQSQHCLLLHLTVRTRGQEEAFWRAEMEKEKVFLKRNVLTESCGSHLSSQHPRRQR